MLEFLKIFSFLLLARLRILSPENIQDDGIVMKNSDDPHKAKKQNYKYPFLRRSMRWQCGPSGGDRTLLAFVLLKSRGHMDQNLVKDQTCDKFSSGPAQHSHKLIQKYW